MAQGGEGGMTFAQSSCPQRTPWGGVQDAEQIAPGIWSVFCSGHGGYKLSRERNVSMPECLRIRGGWYEEDADWSLIALAYPDAFKPEHRDSAVKIAKNWHPLKYQAFAGVELQPGESHILDQQRFKDETADKFVVVAAYGDHTPWVPSNFVGCAAVRKSDDERRWFLVSVTEYNQGRFGFVIDQFRHKQIDNPGL
jgi:hypothetical protein